MPVRSLRETKSNKRESPTTTVFLKADAWYEKAALSISAVKNLDTPKNRSRDNH